MKKVATADQELWDRRRFWRSDCRLPVEVRTLSSRGWRRGRLVDVSDRGMKLRLAFRVRPGMRLEWRAPVFEEEDPFRCTVRWVEPFNRSSNTWTCGAEILRAQTKRYQAFVERLRHIQSWREVQSYLRGKSISFAEAVKRWRETEPRVPSGAKGSHSSG